MSLVIVHRRCKITHDYKPPQIASVTTTVPKPCIRAHRADAISRKSKAGGLVTSIRCPDGNIVKHRKQMTQQRRAMPRRFVVVSVANILSVYIGQFLLKLLNGEPTMRFVMHQSQPGTVLCFARCKLFVPNLFDPSKPSQHHITNTRTE